MATTEEITRGVALLQDFKNTLFSLVHGRVKDGVKYELGLNGHGGYEIRTDGVITHTHIQAYPIMKIWYSLID